MATVGMTASIDRKIIIIGSGHIAGDFYPIAGGICRTINEGRIKHGIRCLVDSTEGSIYNLSALRAGDVDFVLAQSDWAYRAFKGTERFDTVGGNESLRQVVPIVNKPLSLIVAKTSGLNTIAELKGKTIFAGPTEQASNELMALLLKSKGWDKKALNWVADVENGDVGTALCNGDIDAVAFTLTHPNGIIQQIANTCPIKFLDLKEPALEKVIEETPDVVPITLPSAIYIGTDTSDVHTFGYTISLYTQSSQENELVQQLVKVLFEHQAEFQQSHPLLKISDFNPLSSRQAQIPFHKGATDFFKKSEGSDPVSQDR